MSLMKNAIIEIRAAQERRSGNICIGLIQNVCEIFRIKKMEN